jgi:hypothetical protein
MITLKSSQICQKCYYFGCVSQGDAYYHIRITGLMEFVRSQEF